VCRAVKYSSLAIRLSMKLKNAAETFLGYYLMARKIVKPIIFGLENQ
jgi:hypothetical protein